MAIAKTLVLLALPAVVSGHTRRLGSTPSIDTSSGDRSQPTAFTMKSRVYIPYNDMADGLAFGMGAAEQVAYDHVNKYAYAISEQGFINIIDWDDALNPMVRSAWAVGLEGEKLTDIEVCATKGIFFVGSGDAVVTNNGTVRVYSLVDRGNPVAPMLQETITVGPLPDMLLPNSDCTKVAVANEGEGDYDTELVDPIGSVDIIEDDDWKDATGPTVTRVDFAANTDDDYKAAGVHLPLEQTAMIYWDDNSDWKDDLDFANARSTYDARMNLEPEYLAWSGDETKLFVNLQENNAIAVINVPASGAPSYEGVHGLGLKDHGTVGLDITEDDGCSNIKTYTGLKALRHPDSIAAVTIDGVDYILTANEGDDKGYGDWEEKFKLKDLVKSDGTVDEDVIGMTITGNASTTAQAVHVDQGSLRVTVGSSAVDYSDPTAPVVEHIVAFGGRGMSIYKYDSASLELVWDSGSVFETEQCAAYPWAHNGIQDEEFAPKWGVLYNASGAGLQETLDEMNGEDGCEDGGNGEPGACPLGQTIDERSAKDGAGVESVTVGLACGSMIAVTATEKQSGVFVFDVTDPMSPELLFVKHLSPASETKNPGVAYADQTLGEIDPESVIFLDAEHSPSGKAGVMFAGAWSGSMSFWEFTCPDSEDANGATQIAPAVGLLLSILSACLSLRFLAL